MDSSVSPTHGEQEGTAYNGHFGCTCYHPLFLFNQFGDLERSALRPGNVHSAHGWRDVLVPVVDRYKEREIRLYFRGDAAFASPDIYEYLEAEGMLYAIRLPANKVLQESIAHLLRRPVGRPPNHVRRYYASFSYQAGSWDRKRRVVAKVEWHPGELYPRVGFIVTNLLRSAERVTAFYNHRGTAEQWIKEGKNAVKWTRLSCRKFRNNEVRLQLHALAYNLANFMRTLALPKEVEHWSLTSLGRSWSRSGPRSSLMADTSRFRWRKSPCLATCSGKSCGGSMNCDHRPLPQAESGGERGVTKVEVCPNEAESAEIGPPRGPCQRKCVPSGKDAERLFANPACSAIIGTNSRGHLGNVGL